MEINRIIGAGRQGERHGRGRRRNMTVELIYNYFIDIDEMNHTLKKRKIVVGKDGTTKEIETIIGYFPSADACLRELVKIGALDVGDKEVVTLKEYSDLIEQNCDNIKEFIKTL